MKTDAQGGEQARRVLSAIDHSLLRPNATADEVRQACELGRRLAVATVCVQPCWVDLAAELLDGGDVGVSSVVGFPLGATVTEAKLMEVISLLEKRVAELDMVINVGWLKSGMYDQVADEVAAIHLACQAAGVPLKVILETCYLSDDEKRRGAELAVEAGAEFVKTSTGFGPAGATVEDVRLLREVVGSRAQVKAAGGIRTAEQVLAMLDAGASRIGTSSTAQIARGLGVEV